jgi:hypothetical protein
MRSTPLNDFCHRATVLAVQAVLADQQEFYSLARIDAQATSAIPGEVPLCVACGGIQLLDLEDA